MKSTYGAEESVVAKLDRWVGPDAGVWGVLDDKIIPFMTKMTIGMLVLLGVTAAINGNAVFAAVVAGLLMLGYNLRREGNKLG